MKSMLLSMLMVMYCMTACSSNKLDNNDPYSGVKPEITSISPLTGDINSLITIKGKNFGQTPTEIEIFFGSKQAAVKYLSPTVATFNVPKDVLDGDYSVSVKVNDKTAQSPTKFYLRLDQSTISHEFPATPLSVNALFVKNEKNLSHPRLYYHKEDIERVKSLAASDQFAKPTYDYIISEANKVLTTNILKYALDGAGLRVSNMHTFGGSQAQRLALAYLFTADPKYVDRFVKQLDEMATWPDWGADRHFLDVGIGASGIAMCFDAMYDALTEQQRDKIYSSVKKYALDPAITQMRKNKSWTLAINNWNGICNGGVLEAALAFYEYDPTTHAEIISRAINNMPIYLRTLEPDGASEEGISYWSYGISNTIMSLEALKCNLGQTYGIADFDGVKKTGWHPYDMAGPVGTISIGDAPLNIGVQSIVASYFWFPYHFNDASLAKTHYDRLNARNASRLVKMNDWIDLLFYDPNLIAQGASVSTALSKEIKGINYAFVKENNDINGFYAGFHGGDNAANHGHIDAGAFYIQANGEFFIHGSLGNVSPYPGDFFTNSKPAYADAPTNTVTLRGRQCYYKVRAEAKSVLVINPDARHDQNITGVATIDKSTDSYYIMNLAQCYNRDVTEYKRGLKIDRERRAITIQDELTLKASSKVYWIAHSQKLAGAELSADKRTITLNSSGKRLVAEILSPVGATFTIVPAVTSGVNYLPETAPIFANMMGAANTVNKNFGKLQIEFSGLTGKQTICVEFRDVTSSQGTLKPLSSW